MGRLLLVEDHSAFAQAVAKVLGASPRVEAVAVARTLAEGREVAFGGLSGFDLAVVDLRLSDGDGAELVKEIKERAPGTPVLVLSIAEDLSQALRAGADEALRKDATLPTILGTIERLMARSPDGGGAHRRRDPKECAPESARRTAPRTTAAPQQERERRPMTRPSEPAGGDRSKR